MKIGIIGGSGLYESPGIEVGDEVQMDTPYGKPSDVFVNGRLEDHEVYFLPRHGRGHRLLPSEINHRANIYGFKCLEVEIVISVTAVGSLRELYKPGDIMMPDQYFDRTKQSASHTFFGDGIVAHVPFGDPVCPTLHGLLRDTAVETVPEGVDVHGAGTYVNIEGPAFSTRSESHFYRKNSFDVVGMTSLPEAKLCREAGICYASMAMITDYDCWRESEEAVTAEMVAACVAQNKETAKAVLKQAIKSLPDERNCGCAHALSGAIMSDLESLSPKRKAELAPIVGRLT